MKKVEEFIKQGIVSGVFPGLALVVARGTEVLYHDHAGFAQLCPEPKEMNPNTLFDLASITKPVATTTAIMLLVQRGRLSLSDKVQDYLSQFDGHGKNEVTIRHLLSHSSGLSAWKPYYKEIPSSSITHFEVGKSFISNKVLQEGLVYGPGQKAVYSDLGYILLGMIIEKVTQQTLDSFCYQNIFGPMGLSQTFFINLEKKGKQKSFSLANIAATEECPWRCRIIVGEVHDENTYAMGGVAGHSGLFSSAQDLCKFAQVMISCYQGRNDLIGQSIVQEFFHRQMGLSGSTWALGWDTPSLQKSSAGRYFTSQSVGHLGFTGTSLWIDLEQEIIVVLLTNRVHPRRSNEQIKIYRPMLHDLIMEELVYNYGDHSHSAKNGFPD
jgi:serine-type D-Ala-D-Ala carboxypeptidase